MTISTNAPVNGSTNDGIGGSGTGVISTYTAAQLTALAASSGLTQYATYVASDTGVWYRAISTSVLVSDGAQSAATEAAMVAVGGAVIGSMCLRTDVGEFPDSVTDGGTLYELTALPSTDAQNWQPVRRSPAPMAEQFISEQASDVVWEDIYVSASGVVVAGPCILGGIFVATAGTSLSLYDALSATGTQLLPSVATTTLNSWVGLLDATAIDDDEGVAFDTGLYLTVTGGALIVRVRKLDDMPDKSKPRPKVWRKSIVSGDGLVASEPCVVRGVCCLTTGDLVLYDSGSTTHTDKKRWGLTSIAANAKYRIGGQTGMRFINAIYADITGGTYAVLHS